MDLQFVDRVIRYQTLVKPIESGKRSPRGQKCMKMERRIAFDLDETLGMPQIADQTIVGFHMRPGCRGLLGRLRPEFTLCLWTVSRRRYLDQILSFGLADYFKETYSWRDGPEIRLGRPLHRGTSGWKSRRHCRPVVVGASHRTYPLAHWVNG